MADHPPRGEAAVPPVPSLGDHLDQVLQARLSVECCCTAENGGTYCGQPECDIYYCHDCGDEFSEPCPRHEGVNTP